MLLIPSGCDHLLDVRCGSFVLGVLCDEFPVNDTGDYSDTFPGDLNHLFRVRDIRYVRSRVLLFLFLTRTLATSTEILFLLVRK